VYDAVLTVACIAVIIGLGWLFSVREREAFARGFQDLIDRAEDGGQVWIVRMAERIPVSNRIRTAIARSKANGMLGYLFNDCDALVYATEGNFGPQRCPCCGRQTLLLWGRIRTLELDPEGP